MIHYDVIHQLFSVQNYNNINYQLKRYSISFFVQFRNKYDDCLKISQRGCIFQRKYSRKTYLCPADELSSSSSGQCGASITYYRLHDGNSKSFDERNRLWTRSRSREVGAADDNRPDALLARSVQMQRGQRPEDDAAGPVTCKFQVHGPRRQT